MVDRRMGPRGIGHSLDTRSFRNFASGLPQRAGANGTWYDPRTTPAPPSKQLAKEQRLTDGAGAARSVGRQHAVARVKESRREQSLANASSRGPLEGGLARVSPSNPLRPRKTKPSAPDQPRGASMPRRKTARKSRMASALSSRGDLGSGSQVEALAASSSTSAAAPGGQHRDESSWNVEKQERDESSLSTEMRYLSELELSSERLLNLAEGLEENAIAKERVLGREDTLWVVLGNMLMEEISKGTKEHAQQFFRELDVNGDGFVSRIEFRQMMERATNAERAPLLPIPPPNPKRDLTPQQRDATMSYSTLPMPVSCFDSQRKLGLLGDGVQFDTSAVDALFDDLDEDHGGELDLSELTAGLKKLKAKVVQVHRRDAKAKGEAEYLRERAGTLRDAAEKVGAAEDKAAELHGLRSRPPVELRLAGVLATKQLKPADLLAKMDKDQNDAVDEREFAQALRAFGLDATSEEFHSVFKQLDKHGAGVLGLDEIKQMVTQGYGAKEHEKKLVKDAASVEQAAREVRNRVRAELMEDQRREEEAAVRAERAVKEKEREVEAQLLAVQVKAEAKARRERMKKEEFEKRIEAKRKDRDKAAC